MFHQHYTTLTIFVITVMNGIAANHLIGDHICSRNEKYIVTYEKNIKKNITTREFIWCMSVPPRCSKYVTRQVDDIRIFEEERIKKVNICCEGYIEDESRTYCVPHCKLCINGDCTDPEKCSCRAGFTGLSCNETCHAGFWGPDCTFPCACAQKGPCKPDTGNCICEPGTTGPKCEISILAPLSNCTIEDCNDNNITLPEINKTKEHNTIEEKIFTLLPNEKETTSQVPSTVTLDKQEITHTQNHTSDYNSLLSKKNFNFIGKIPQFLDKNSEHWQMDDVVIKNSDSSNIKNTLLVFIISVAIGVFIIFILLTVMFIMIARYKKQRDLAIRNVLHIKSVTDNNKNRLSTEPIIQRSVFHTPLPDPPVFQNPVFTLRDSKNNNQVQYSNFTDLSLQNSHIQYDYPPSGSYRTLSLPDSGLDMTTEPVYDEIPASRRPRPVSVVGNCDSAQYQ